MIKVSCKIAFLKFLFENAFITYILARSLLVRLCAKYKNMTKKSVFSDD